MCNISHRLYRPSTNSPQRANTRTKIELDAYITMHIRQDAGGPQSLSESRGSMSKLLVPTWCYCARRRSLRLMPPQMVLFGCDNGHGPLSSASCRSSLVTIAVKCVCMCVCVCERESMYVYNGEKLIWGSCWSWWKRHSFYLVLCCLCFLGMELTLKRCLS